MGLFAPCMGLFDPCMGLFAPCMGLFAPCVSLSALVRVSLPQVWVCSTHVYGSVCPIYENPRQSWVLDSTLCIPDSKCWILAFESATGYQSLGGLWISLSVFWIPKPRISDSTSNWNPGSRIPPAKFSWIQALRWGETLGHLWCYFIVGRRKYTFSSKSVSRTTETLVRTTFFP